MKNKLLAPITAILIPSLTHGSIFISGSAIVHDPNVSDLPDISIGEHYVYLVDLDGSAFSANELLSLDAGLSLTDSSSYDGFSVIGNGLVDNFFGMSFVGSSSDPIELLAGAPIDGINSGDSFGILVFDGSSDTTMASDTYSIFTDTSWVLPSDGNTITFSPSYDPNNPGSEILQIRPGNGPAAFGSVVGAPIPEPSTYALFIASLAMVFVVARRSQTKS